MPNGRATIANAVVVHNPTFKVQNGAAEGEMAAVTAAVVALPNVRRSADVSTPESSYEVMGGSPEGSESGSAALPARIATNAVYDFGALAPSQEQPLSTGATYDEVLGNLGNLAEAGTGKANDDTDARVAHDGADTDC